MLLNNLEVSKEILNFLKQNKSGWEISNDMVMFNSQTLLNQYNELASKLQG